MKKSIAPNTNQVKKNAQNGSQDAPENGSRLGNNAKYATPPQIHAVLQGAENTLPDLGDIEDYRVFRYALQSVARSLLYGSRVSKCHRIKARKDSSIACLWSEPANRASYANLQTCGSVWSCPICAAKIGEQRRVELKAIIEAHKASVGGVALVTRTVPHSQFDKLSDLLERVTDAQRKYVNGAPYKRFKTSWGVVGSVRALETTTGGNGWHPHYHEILFFRDALDNGETVPLKHELFPRWESACSRAGISSPSWEHGMDCQDASYASSYVSKWGADSELTKAHTKRGRNGSFTPFDLLRLALLSSDHGVVDAAGNLFQEYSAQFRGKRQLVYSNGLKKLYDLEDLSDEEIAEKNVDPESQLLGAFTDEQWKQVLKYGRGHFLKLVETKKRQGETYPFARSIQEMKEVCNGL